MSSDLSRETLEATFSQLAHLVIIPARLTIEDEEAVGAGGYGEVCLATLDKSSRSQRKVVVKRLRMVEAGFVSQRIAFRLARELKVWAKVKHPNILELIGYYVSDNYVRAQFVSAFMVNGNVMQYIRRFHVDVATRLKFVRDTAAGLTYLHDFSPPICHGNLKPANVLVNDLVDAVLCDFGVSSFIRESNATSSLTTLKSTKGSLRYMSPELILRDESKHTLQSDIWAWGCTALEVMTESIPYSTSIKDPAIILEVVQRSAPGSIEALSTAILGPGVDPACRTGVSSLRSIIPHCWDFDPTKRPRSSEILERIALPSRFKAHSGAWENQEGGTSSLRIQNDSRHVGCASTKDVARYQSHQLCMNCQRNPKVGEQDFCSKACRDDASSRLRASAQSNPSSPRFNRPTFSKLVSRFTVKRPEISTPSDPVHLTHVGFDPSTGESFGLPREWEPVFQENTTARQHKDNNLQAMVETYQGTAGAPGKTADNDMATSPTTSGNYNSGEGLRNNSQAKPTGASQATPSRRKPKDDQDDGARAGPFRTSGQKAPQDPQPVTHHHQPNSILKKIYDIGRFRLHCGVGGSGSGQGPFLSAMSVPTIPASADLRSAQTHRSAQPSSDLLKRPVAVKQLRSTDMDPSNERRMRKRLGRANIWAGLDGNTPGRQGSPLVDPPHISTPKTGPSTYVAGFNPPETPDQEPFPSLLSLKYGRKSFYAQPDDESDCHPSWVKQSAPSGNVPESTIPDEKLPYSSNQSTLQIRPWLEIDGLWDESSSTSGKRSKRLNALDCTGQLKERTGQKFTGSSSDVSQAKLGDRVVAVKELRVANIKNGEDRIWKRLARETYVWAAFCHPNVLELLGFSFEGGIPCLISPWCENGTLQEYLQKFPDANRRRLVREIAEGLRYLHAQTPPLIHGDLKTTNILVTGDYVAKISDFGTSRRVEQLRTGFTPACLVPTAIRYTAPERLLDGRNPTMCSDVFSFACVALETMTDKYPFWKIPNDVEVISQVALKKQKPSPEDHPGMEEAIWELLRRCWDYEPSDRPKMTDVCQTLAGAGYGPPTSFNPPALAGPSTTFDVSLRGGPFYPPTREDEPYETVRYC